MAVNKREKIIAEAKEHKGQHGNFVWNYWSGLPWGQSWCVGFVLYCIYKAGFSKSIYSPSKISSPFWVPTIEEWLHAHAKHVKMADAKAGDIVIFTWTGGGNNARKIGRCSRDHIGFIRNKGTSNTAYTIEGNTSGGIVDEKTRPLTNIFAIYRLDLSAYKKTRAQKIYEMAKKCSYKMGTGGKAKYPSGHAKKAYKKALNKAYKDRSGWRDQTKKGASCDVFVGTCVRASGVDKKFPRGLDDIKSYMKTEHFKKNFKKLKNPKRKQLKPGDITYQIFHDRIGHVTIYMGGNKVANAHYYGKSYPIIEKYSNKVRKPSNTTTFYAFRPREKQKK